MFKDHLIRHVETSLNDLQEFIQTSDKGIIFIDIFTFIYRKI